MPKAKKKTTVQSKIKFNKWIGVAIVALVAVMGSYLLFFADAAANNCTVASTKAESTKICDVNQVSHPSGTDSAFAVNDEYSALVGQGWTNWGVAFRAPNSAFAGAKPVHRFYNKPLTAHYLIIESDPLYAQFKADPTNNVDEGIFFYAWDNGNVKNTEPVHRVNRKPWYFLQMYSTNRAWVDQFVANPDNTWEYGGIAFYAYNANYFPPANTSTPGKDTNCPNQNLRPGDRGACVKTLKGMLNGYGAKLDTNNDSFDTPTNDHTRFFVAKLREGGSTVPAYSNVVTADVWNGLTKGFPPKPATATTPAQPGSVPTRTTNGGSATPGGSTGAAAPAPAGGTGTPIGAVEVKRPGDVDTYLRIINESGGNQGVVSMDCHTWWLTFIKNRNDPKGNVASVGAISAAVAASQAGQRAAEVAIGGVLAGPNPSSNCNLGIVGQSISLLSLSLLNSKNNAQRLTTIVVKKSSGSSVNAIVSEATQLNLQYAQAKFFLGAANTAFLEKRCDDATKLAVEAKTKLTSLSEEIAVVSSKLFVLSVGPGKPIIFDAGSPAGIGAIAGGGQVIRYVW